MTDSFTFASVFSSRLREEHLNLISRWQDRVSARVNLDADSIFLAQESSASISIVLAGIADFVEDAAAELSANSQLLAVASELGLDSALPGVRSRIRS